MTAKFIRLINRNGVNETSQKFDLGQLTMTPKIEILMEDSTTKSIIEKCLHRHHNGDWGDLDSEDKNTNDLALKSGNRLFSAYKVGLNKIWIITEWDRSVTTILDPSEY